MTTLQIHPTSLCNRNCSFCSYRESDLDCELDFNQIVEHMLDAKRLGCKELKVTGGGEPLMYSDIHAVLYLAKRWGYKIYLQTNGILLNRVHRAMCDDIRISYGDGIKFKPPKILPDGFSYVVTTEPDYVNLNNIIRYSVANDMYVRITQDETANLDDLPEIDETKSHLVKSRNVKYWDVKSYHKGANPCKPSIQSPLIGADGYIYPCCRTQYAQDVTLGYNTNMRMGRDLNKIQPYDGSGCVRCYYGI